MTGNAARLAAEKCKLMMFDVAAPLLGVKAESARSAATIASTSRGYPQRNMHIGDVANHARVVTGEPPIGSGYFNPATVALDPETGQGKPFATYVYATQIAEVDVDDETGEVDVLRIVASHDCGTPINPMLVEGQVEGGISMGVGFALQEEILFDAKGRQMNPNLTNYIMPTSLDMPDIEVDIVDNYDPTGPFGAKGVGEPTCVLDRGRDPERDPRRGRRAHHVAARDGREGAQRHQGEAAPSSRDRLPQQAESTTVSGDEGHELILELRSVPLTLRTSNF